MKIYFDNAATTPLHPEVMEVMLPIMKNQYGNPSSIHAAGREARTIVEQARKTIAALLNASPSEIFFTSGGTEANNMAIRCSICDLSLDHAVSTAIEHHAVEHTLKALKNKGDIKLSYLRIDGKGSIDLQHLEDILKTNKRSLVSLMHANNELGTLMPIEKVSEICKRYDAVFHSDGVQTIGHYMHDLKKVSVDYLSAAAHKFHGPKGTGFLYINSRIKVNPFITGGAQERNMRGGTENVYGIAGMAKALEIACRDMVQDRKHITQLRSYMIERLKEEIAEISFNSDIESESLYTVLNVSFPPNDNNEMLLFNLDIAGIAASGGSACSSGSSTGSHVLNAIGADAERASVRFSFSKFNNKGEVDFAIKTLKELYPEKVKI